MWYSPMRTASVAVCLLAHEYGHHVQDLLGILKPGGGQGAQSQSYPFGS
jgi:predicted metalloprotease